MVREPSPQWKPRWLPLLAAMATGSLMALAAPGVLPFAAASWLAWIAFVPLLLALPHVAPRRAAWLGATAGFVLQLGAFAWLPGLLARFNGLHPVWAVASALLIFGFQSLGWAAWATAVRLTSPRWPTVLVVPVAFVAMESLAPLLFPYSVGLTQVRNLVVVQAAELGGPQIVSAMLVATGAALAGLLRRGKSAIPAAAATAGLLAVLLAWGAVRLHQTDAARELAPTLRVGWVQAGVVHDAWTPPPPDPDTLTRYQQGSAKLEREHGRVDLLLWPEKSYGLLPRDAKHDFPRSHPRRIRKGFHSALLLGHTSVDRRTRDIGNAAALLGADGQLRVVYEKARLIPYSEWVPPWAERWTGKRYRPGTSLEPVLAGASGPAAVPIGTFICYEATFPSFVRAVTGEGASLLVNLSDDTWFGDTAEPEQHLAHVVFRAVENRRDIVRVTGAGVSAAVTGSGRVLERTGLNRGRSVQTGVAEVSLLVEGSLYRAMGEAVPIACAIASGLWLVGTYRERRRRRTAGG